MSLIAKYKNIVSKEDAVVTETNEKQEPVNKIYDEPAQKELATGSVEALVSDLVKVLNNNPSLEAQNPFVIQSLRTIDNARGFNASKHSYKHFKSLKQVKTALEGLLNQLTK